MDIYKEYREKLIQFIEKMEFDKADSLYGLMDLLMEAKEITWRRYYLAEGYKDNINVGFILYNIRNIQYARELLAECKGAQSIELWDEFWELVGDHFSNWTM